MKEQPKNPTESFSRQLTYSSAKSSRKEKENESNMKDSFSSRGSKRTKKTQSSTSSTCCLCNREGGMILRCQCNNANCELRAHPMCIGKFRLGKSDSDKTILCSEAWGTFCLRNRECHSRWKLELLKYILLYMPSLRIIRIEVNVIYKLVKLY